MQGSTYQDTQGPDVNTSAPGPFGLPQADEWIGQLWLVIVLLPPLR